MIDLVIPVRNGAKFIDDALESAHNQSVPPSVIYVVDDGSTDETIEIVKRWAARSPLTLKLISQPPSGVSSARNTAISAGKSEFVSFLDADDILVPTHHERLLELMRAVPRAVVAFGDAKFVPAPPKGHPTVLSRWSQQIVSEELSSEFLFRTMLLHGSIVATCASLVRRSAISQSGLFDINLAYAEDRDFWLRLSRLGPFAVTSQVVAHIRIHNDNVTADRNESKIAAGAVAVCKKFLGLDLSIEERLLVRTALKNAYRNFLYQASLSNTSTFINGLSLALRDGQFSLALNPRHMLRHLRRVWRANGD